MKNKFLFFVIASSLFPLLSSTLHAHSLDQLRQDVAALKMSVQNSNQKLAEAMNLLTSMQQEFASIKGVTESGGHFYEEQNRSLREYDQRLSAMEDKLNVLTNLLKDIKDKNVSSGIPDKVGGADLGQTQEFQKLLDYVNSEDWNKALPGFQGFIQHYPRSPLADNAQYWVAESYYGLGNYKKAIAEYQVLIQKYPRSSKSKNALLKQGLSFFNLKMYAEAKPFLEKVMGDYPGSAEAAQASAKIKEIQRISATPAPASPALAANPVAPASPAPTAAPQTTNPQAPYSMPVDPRFSNTPTNPAPPAISPSPAPPSSGVTNYPQPTQPARPYSGTY